MATGVAIYHISCLVSRTPVRHNVLACTAPAGTLQDRLFVGVNPATETFVHSEVVVRHRRVVLSQRREGKRKRKPGGGPNG